MKRKSTLILIAALVLAVSIPVFALAAGGPRFASATGTAVNGRYAQSQFNGETAPQLNQLALGDFQVDEDGFCYYLDANGEPQRVYSRGANGQFLYLQLQDGEYCWSEAGLAQSGDPVQLNNSFGGRGGSRWN